MADLPHVRGRPRARGRAPATPVPDPRRRRPGRPLITGLWYYPVKGCAGTRVTAAPVTPAGLRHDRSFVVVDGDGVTRTQRRHPRLAAVRPEITPDGARLTLRAPGHEPVSVAVTTHGPTGPVDLFGTAFRGVDQGETAAGWLSEVLGAHSRLARVPPDHHRVTDGLTPGTSGYADSCPITCSPPPPSTCWTGGWPTGANPRCRSTASD